MFSHAKCDKLISFFIISVLLFLKIRYVVEKQFYGNIKKGIGNKRK